MSKKIGLIVTQAVLFVTVGALAGCDLDEKKINHNTSAKNIPAQVTVAAPAKENPKPAVESAPVNEIDSVAEASSDEVETIGIVRIDDSNFEQEILKSDKNVILEFSSTSCPPCLIMIPTLINMAKNYKNVKIGSVGIDEPGIEKIKNTFPIQAFPTIFFIQNGRIVNRIVGAASEEQMLAVFGMTTADKVPAPKTAPKKTGPKHLSCSINGQFSGLKNFVTMTLDFVDNEIKNVDLVTDVFIPPELESRREFLFQRFSESGKGEVSQTATGFRMHTANDHRFIKAMNMDRNSSYGEMKAGLELQGFKCK